MISTSTNQTRADALAAARLARSWPGYQSATVIDCGGLWLLAVALSYPAMEH